jgi:hypothetical protein
VSVAAFVTPLAAAEMEALVLVATSEVVTLNVPVVAPAAIVNVPGTVAAPFELASATASPPEGATPVKVSVAVDGEPPLTADGFRVRDCGAGVFTDNVTVDVRPV